MKNLRTLLATAFLALVAVAATNFTRFNTVIQSSGPPTADVVCNIATGVFTGLGGGTCATITTTCAGGADAAPAFNSFNTWALTFQAAHPGILIQLNTPADVCQWISGSAGNNSFTRGIKRLQIVGYGTTFGDNAGTGGGFALGWGGVHFDNTHSARFATIIAGATSITLLDTSQCGLFAANDWTLLAGIDPQGFGDPPNPQIYEYIEIASVASCAGSGVITLKRPTSFGYKSTWPLYNAGNPFNTDCGGPATAYALDQTWDIDQAFYGIEFDQRSGHTNVNGRTMALVDVSVLNTGFGPIPSQNVLFSVTNGNFLFVSSEIDKIVETASYTNFNSRKLQFQSGSAPLNFNCTDCDLSPVGLQGTPRNTTLVRGTIDALGLGASSYGYSGSLSATNTAFTGVQIGGSHSDNIQTRGVWSATGLTVPRNVSVVSSGNNGSGLIRLTVNNAAGWTTGITTDITASVETAAAALCGGFQTFTFVDGTHLDIQGSDATANYVSISIASPAVITKTSHGFVANQKVAFGTTSALPNGLTAGTVYFIISTGLTANTFEVSATPGGTALNTSGSQSGQQSLQCLGNIGSLPLTWAVPGANMYFSGGQGAQLGPVLRVDDLYQDANNATVVTFTQNGSPYTGGFPTLPFSQWSLTSHPMPSWSCIGCTGVSDIIDVTGAAAAGLPFGSYTSRILTAANSNVTPRMPAFGLLTDLSVTVTAACGGASNISMDGPIVATVGSSSTGAWDPTVNGLIASGTPRVVTPTTSSGAQSGDVLTSPGTGTWLFTGQVLPKFSNVGNCGSAAATLTLRTNQGVTFP